MSSLITEGLGFAPYSLIIDGFWPNPPAADFLNGVKQRISKSTLASSLNGQGVYLKKPARANLPAPFIVAEETGASLSLVTNTLQIHDTRVRFRVYGEGAAVAGGIGDRLEDLMNDCSFAFTGGFCSRWLRGDRRHELDQELSTPGNEVWHLQIEYTTKVKR